MFELTDKVAIVTGGTSGIGEATCYEIAKQGGKVVVVGRNEERGQAVLEKVKELGSEGIFVKADLTKQEDIANIVEQTIATFGKLDIAANVAGIVMNHMPLHEVSDELYEQMLATNFYSVFYCMKYEIPEMLKNGKGAIVNVASIAGMRGFHNMCLYSATKAAVIGLSRAAAMDYADQGIRINSVCPGSTITPIVPPEVEKAQTPGIPSGKWGKPEEIADLIVALLADELGNVIGANFLADNGEITCYGKI